MPMRATLPVLIGLTSLLAACGEKPSGQPPTREEVREEVQKVQLKPGQWEGAYELVDIDLPHITGGDAQIQEHMRKKMSRAAITYCTPPDDTAKPHRDKLTH